jgi:hypothetical protein
MCKQVGVTMSSKSVPYATHWYIEPAGEFTKGALANMLPETRCAPKTVCSDGKARNFWSVTHIEVVYFQEIRKTKGRLRFAVWYKDKQTSKVVLWRNYIPLACCSPRRRLRR